MVHGPVEYKIIAQVSKARGNIKLPDSIINKPELLSGLGRFYDAFWQLTTCRPEAGALIPWTAINAWAIADRMDDMTSSMLALYIRQMDLALLKWLRVKNKSKEAPKPDGNA